MIPQYFRNKVFNIIMGSTHPAYSIATFDTEEKDFREKYWDIKKNDIVFDVGASYGAYTLAACAMEAIVYTFEPEKSVYFDLLANISVNGWNNRCFPQNFGLWDQDGTVDMKSYAPHWPPQTITTDYSMKTLNKVVEENNITKIDWIKIDVEGAEENVIKGGLESIEKFTPKMIIECHNFQEILRDPCVMLLATPK